MDTIFWLLNWSVLGGSAFLTLNELLRVTRPLGKSSPKAKKTIRMIAARETAEKAVGMACGPFALICGDVLSRSPLNGMTAWALDPVGLWAAWTILATNFVTFWVCKAYGRKARLELGASREDHGVFHVQVTSGELESDINIWIRQRPDQESWPPLFVEVGVGNMVAEATEMVGKEALEMSKILSNTKVLEQEGLADNLRSCLKNVGATHPMDIEGSECIPMLQGLLEECLLKPQSASK
jgi:hypothetical protein